MSHQPVATKLEVSSLIELMIALLDHACPSNCREDGWNVYWIETHCVGFWITARKIEDTWEILTVTAEDC